MRSTRIIGPATGRTYEAHDTGEQWNGAAVLAFTFREMHALIAAGDGQDANGYGLTIEAGMVLDVAGPGHVEPVPVIAAEVGGDTLLLYVPQGRIWDEVSPAGTPVIGYDTADRCRACGAHVADPHAPQCPAAVATALRAEAEANDQAHAAAVESGGYGPEQAPAEVSHRFAAVAQRLAADLIELDHLGAVSLDAWPEAAEFVGYLTGEADQWTP